MSRSGEDHETGQPRQHKQILEAAADDPDASLAELAERVPGVSTETVERVLDDAETDEPADDGTDAYPDRDDISERQIRTLQAIAAHPDATQRDIASFLDVTAATVSNRVNSLPGFEWDDRRRFVKEVLELDTVPGEDRSALIASSDIELHETIGDLIDRVERLERRLKALDTNRSDGSRGLLAEDPELARKVVHLCMESEDISDEEELRILQHFVNE